MIKIIKGTYGYLDKNGIVKPKTEKDGPFSLTEEQEDRLVRLGVAIYVDQGDTALPDGVDGIPEYNVDMKATELRAIAEKMGLSFKVGTTKAEMVAAMDKFLEENVVQDPDKDPDKDPGDDPAADDSQEDGDDGEPLPEFDPTEAVE